MKKEIFDFRDYKAYLKDWIESQPGRGRGQRSAIAEALGSPTSHISQVLSGDSHFSLELADRLNQFLGHTEPEALYFMNLIQLARAGTPSLKKFLNAQIERAQTQRRLERSRAGIERTLTAQDQATYYSTWQFAAVHIAITIERLQTKEGLAQHLGLSIKRITEIVDFLSAIGLVRAQRGRLVQGEARLHLDIGSPMLAKHHMNWRLQAMRALEQERGSEDLHYSSVISISQEDWPRLRAMLSKAIESGRTLVRDSGSEELLCFAVDLFRVRAE